IGRYVLFEDLIVMGIFHAGLNEDRLENLLGNRLELFTNTSASTNTNMNTNTIINISRITDPFRNTLAGHYIVPELELTSSLSPSPAQSSTLISLTTVTWKSSRPQYYRQVECFQKYNVDIEFIIHA